MTNGYAIRRLPEKTFRGADLRERSNQSLTWTGADLRSKSLTEARTINDMH
jgi:hypothetical protein